MKRLLALFAFASAAFASDTAVLISDTLHLQSPTAWTGNVTVSWPAFTASGGTQVAAGSRTYTITAGSVAISLYSTVGASPSFLYTARYRDTGTTGTVWTETWYVPASGPVVLNDVRRSSTLGIGLTYRGAYAGRPTSPHLYDLALFTDASSPGDCGSSGGSSFAVCAWNGSAWAPTSIAGSGSSFTLSTMTNSQLLALTNSQLLSLAN